MEAKCSPPSYKTQRLHPKLQRHNSGPVDSRPRGQYSTSCPCSWAVKQAANTKGTRFLTASDWGCLSQWATALTWAHEGPRDNLLQQDISKTYEFPGQMEQTTTGSNGDTQGRGRGDTNLVPASVGTSLQQSVAIGEPGPEKSQ